ncbi:MAG: DNA-deoxyinosine glycosylase [Clostridiales bacterium]|nr:DNA-deoxyinosine glycosylase [Clostridiales bacterium]
MHGFLPVVDDRCKVLVLGSFPSTESLRKQEYYAHKSNSFWKIIFALFEEPYSLDYDHKKAFLLRNHIALWDVVYSHEGFGSADKDIKNPVMNDFSLFFKQFGGISHIFFNGGASEEMFSKLVPKEYKTDIPKTRLYSTSPANARYSFEEKLKNWSQLKESLIKL